jgi:hypothetical protein
VLTAVAVAVNVALDAPAATVTEAGTVTALLLLVRLTTVALAAAPVRVTVQGSVAAPVSDALLHETALTAGCPVPLSAIVAVTALLVIVTVPVAAPAVVGSKPTVKVAVCPGFSVKGVLRPDAENPAPLTVTPLIVAATDPDDVTVTDWLVAVLSNSVPNATLVVLKLSPAVEEFSCRTTLFELVPTVAVRVAVCAVFTADATAANPALHDPVGGETEAGTVTALLLLAMITVSGPVVWAVKVTVHQSELAPVIDVLVQENPSTPGCPVPLSAIVAALDALLAIVTVPVAAPTTAGSNPTVSVAVWPGFSVNGVLIPDSENPAPVIETPLIVRGAVPVDVTVTDCVAVVFSDSAPKATLVVLKLSAVVAAFSCNE